MLGLTFATNGLSFTMGTNLATTTSTTKCFDLAMLTTRSRKGYNACRGFYLQLSRQPQKIIVLTWTTLQAGTSNLAMGTNTVLASRRLLIVGALATTCFRLIFFITVRLCDLG